MFKNYFYHNSIERKAGFLLLSAVFVLWILAWLWPYFVIRQPIDFDSFSQKIIDFENDIALSEAAAQAARENKWKEQQQKYKNRKNRYSKYKTATTANKEDPEEEEEDIELFDFDPNTASEAELLALGLSPNIVRNILNFRGKGAVFRQKSDLAKIYGLKEDDYIRLESFISLPDSIERRSNPGPNIESAATDPIEINTATAEDFRKLKGIGPSFAERIVKYRNALGGFVKVEQLAEVYGLPDSVFLKIQSSLRCNSATIKKININTADIETLKAHPYLRWKHAKAIVQWREENGNYKDIELLRSLMEFDDNEGTYWKIAPYLIR